MKLLKLSCITALLLILSGCSTEETNSEEVRTEGIWVDMKVESDGVRSRAVAELNVSSANGNNLVLGAQDKLTVSAAGQSKTMLKDTDFLDIDYQEYMDAVESGTEFTIALTRQGDTDAPDSKVELPPSFAIHAPLTTDFYNKDQTIQIDWDGLGDNKDARLTFTTYCRNTANQEITLSQTIEATDDGSYDLMVGSLNLYDSQDVDLTKDCTLDITIRREQTGQVDPMYKAGSKIIGAQYRQVKDIMIDN